ncbi:MAG: transglutaminase family protein [Blastopirellula sp. JB062]
MNTILSPARVIPVLSLATILTIGCTNEVEPTAPSPTNKTSPVEQTAPPSEPPADVRQPSKPLAEYWSAVMQQGRKIGNSHEVVRCVHQAGRILIETVSVEEIAIRRQEQTIEMRVVNRFLETSEAELVSYETKIEQGTNISSFTGQVSPDGNRLAITTTAAGRSATAPIPWQPQWGGVYAASQALKNPPIEPGQTRTATALVPTINQACQIQYVAGKREPVRLLDGGEVELLKVTNLISQGGQPLMEIEMWVDQEGNAVKLRPPGPDLTVYRCTPEFAHSPIESIEFDLAAETIVPLEQPLTGVHADQTSAEYLITWKKRISPRLFPTGGGQWTADVQDDSLHLHCVALRPDVELPPQLAKQTPPTDADLAASSLVQVDDPAIRELADQIAPGDRDRWQLAVEIERQVHELIEQKDFSQAFASAADVARSRTGDCTEHAVLLIALLRAHDIPARAAVGLVYYDGRSGRGFAYHMWTEAWINDRWIPLDATLGLGGIGTGHIKIADSDLAGGGAFAAFLPVTQVIGNIEIKPLASE